MHHKAEAGGEEEWIKNIKHTNNRKMIVERTNSEHNKCRYVIVNKL
jgi:hypothetical protein